MGYIEVTALMLPVPSGTACFGVSSGQTDIRQDRASDAGTGSPSTDNCVGAYASTA